jgi:hypothetical protein
MAEHGNLKHINRTLGRFGKKIRAIHRQPRRTNSGNESESTVSNSALISSHVRMIARPHAAP